jgi:hypothetical protein
VLNLSRCEITQIEGLNRLVNLEELDLSQNKIGKIEGFDHLLNLKVLRIGHNPIRKIEGLGELQKLSYLSLFPSKIAQDLGDIHFGGWDYHEDGGGMVYCPQLFVRYCKTNRLPNVPVI